MAQGRDAERAADDEGAPAADPVAAKKKAAKRPAAKKKAAKKKATKKSSAAEAADDGAEAPKKKAARKAAAKKTPAKKKATRRPAAPADLDLDEDLRQVEGEAFVDTDDDGPGGRDLVVVESPAKAKTINKFLGKGYRVMASMGHVRDLPENDLGVDLEHGFEPTYEPLAEKKKVIAELRSGAKDAGTVWLACDMDREGEAIAWHVAELLPPAARRRCKRVAFNQITRDAIRKAFEHPRALDMNKVNAQQARRVLDRIVGYKLSQLLWKKVRRGLSAGRVQSVAVRIVVEREKEIQAFVPVEYWELDATLDAPRLRGELAGTDAAAEQPPPWQLQASLIRLAGEKLDPAGRRVASEAEARAVEAALATARYRVASVEQRERRANPRPPFITSTLQQAASSELGFGAKRTMQIAQGLYEGVDVGGEGAVGLITYMRTDSFALAPEAVAEARDFVERSFGAPYLPEEPNVYRRGKLKVAAQEAHEAIRPTSVERTPEAVAPYLDGDQLKLYRLIWRRFVACQMTPARFLGMTVDVDATAQDPAALPGGATLRATGSRLLFDGHLRVSGRDQSDRLLPAVAEGDALDLVPPLVTQQKFTQPPPRYTEASLVKRLEAEGIGRPSTYASIIDTIQRRGYVEQVNRALHATTKGMIVTWKLGQFFGDIMDYGYTRAMETNLDRVEGAVASAAPGEAEAELEAGGGDDEGEAEGETLPALDWRDLLAEFYRDFDRDLQRAQQDMKGVNEDPEPTEHPCPACGAKLVKMYNTREFTQFLGCPRYPECKTTVPLDDEGRPAPDVHVDANCPKCSKPLVIKSGRRGRFFACTGYPECKETFELGADGNPVPKPSVDAKCPDCEGEMTVRRGRTGSFLGCASYPKCRGTLPLVQQPDGTWAVGERGRRAAAIQVDVKCEVCEGPMVVKRSRRGAFLGCAAYPKCRSTQPLPEGLKLPEPPKPKAFGEDCEQCGKPLVVREGRRGPFVSCSGYPKCRNTRNLDAEALERLKQAAEAAPAPAPTT